MTGAGAEALSDMDMVKKKFVINLVMPSSDQTGELRLIFETVSRCHTYCLIPTTTVYIVCRRGKLVL